MRKKLRATQRVNVPVLGIDDGLWKVLDHQINEFNRRIEYLYGADQGLKQRAAVYVRSEDLP